MRILMISAEGPPLQRAGALIDVMDALPRELRKRGHQVSVTLPYYREIREKSKLKAKRTGIAVDVRVGDKTYVADYFEARSAGGVQLFLVRCDDFFDRPGIYGEQGQPYEDNAARFIFFCKAALELARRLTPILQILHVHDWAAALVPVFVRAHNLPFATLLTIHHIADQGSFWGLDFNLTNLPERFFTLHGVEFFGRLNFLKGGILYADRITTVSEHYRREISRPSGAGGHGLDLVMRENAHRLTAILHGADYTRWNPASDCFLPAQYDGRRLRGKQACRDALLKEMKLAPAPHGPVFGMVTRVVEEKGFEVLMPLLDRLLWDDVRLIILGEGDPAYETALAIAARKFPDKFAYQKDYDEKLAHLIEAGMDISLIPSRFEPGGNQADIHACFNQVREFFVVILLICEFVWEFSRGDGESGFIGRVAFAENNQADVIPKKSIQKRHKNLEALFLNNPGHHAKDWTVRRRCEFHFFQQRVTAGLFSPQPSAIVLRREETIGGRVPSCVIRPVQNGRQPMRIFAHHQVKAVAARPAGAGYLAPVMFAHRCDPVGIENSTFKKIQPSKKLDAMQGKEPFRQICEIEVQSPETALIGDVMDCQQRCERQVVRAHKHRHERGCPIVDVQNLQYRCQSPGEFQRCLAKKDKPCRVIFVRLALLAINSRPIEKIVAADEKQLHPACASRLEVIGNISFVPNPHIDRDAGSFCLQFRFLSNLTVVRQRHADLVPAFAELSRQRIHHVN